MKLSAVSSRGSKKDFIDLFFLKDIFTWEILIKSFQEKYANSGYNLYHVIKSLAYFDDANDEPIPLMIKKCNWENIQKYFTEIQLELADKYLQ